MNFSDNIKQLRKQKGVTQEALAEHMGVSIQAVSKWECGLSYPDIEFLPVLASYFGVSIDLLLTGEDISAAPSPAPAAAPETAETAGAPAGAEPVFYEKPGFPDDNVLRVVQYKGKKMLTRNIYDPDIMIPLKFDALDTSKDIYIEIWGSVKADGNMAGNIAAGGDIACGEIKGAVAADGDIHCGSIKGAVSAGGDINGNELRGSVSTDGDFSCANVEGNVSAGGDLTCGNVGGNADAGGDLTCADIGGDANAGGDIRCGEIRGGINAGGGISYGNAKRGKSKWPFK